MSNPHAARRCRPASCTRLWTTASAGFLFATAASVAVAQKEFTNDTPEWQALAGEACGKVGCSNGARECGAVEGSYTSWVSFGFGNYIVVPLEGHSTCYERGYP